MKFWRAFLFLNKTIIKVTIQLRFEPVLIISEPDYPFNQINEIKEPISLIRLKNIPIF